MTNLTTIFKNLKHNRHLVVFILALVVTITGTIFFSNSQAFANLQVWANDNFIRFNIFLLLVKILGIVWPPLPGIVFTLGAISVIGWIPALIIDVLGNIIGSTIAFGLARVYGEKLVKFLFGKNGINQLSRFTIKPAHELEALTLILIFGGSLSEMVSYGAGITKVTFINFMIATIASNIIIGLPLFYLFDMALSGTNLILGTVPLIAGVIFFFFLRERYFEIEKIKVDQ